MSPGKPTWFSMFAATVMLGQGTAGAQQSSDLEAVEATHEAYHAAFGKEDIDLMSEIWLHDQSVRLIVPPRDKILTGWEEVRAEFKNAFEVLNIISLSTKDAQTIAGAEFAWTVDVHELEMRASDGQVIKPQFYSTHIFQKVDNRWLMVHHQASAPPASGQ